MNDIYERKYKVVDYLKLTIAYLKSYWILWLSLVVVFIAGLAITCGSLFGGILTTSNKMIRENSAMIKMISEPNLSESQIFILIEFVLMVVQKVIVKALIILLILAFVHSLVSLAIFVSQDLFVRQTKIDVLKYLKYCASRYLPTLMTDIVLGFYLAVLFVLLAAAMMASNFLISDIWLGYFILAGIFILIILAIDWNYVFPAVYKYRVRTNKAIRYSANVVRKNLATTLIWLLSSGGLYLLIAYLLINNIIGAKADNYPSLFTWMLLILVTYNFITKLVNNFIFINCDYLAREKEEAEELYGDLITMKLAPFKPLIEKPRKRNRRTTNSAIKNEKFKKKTNY